MAERGLPSWPKITIRLYDAHNGEVKIAGRSHPVVAADPREAAIAIVAERASQLGRAVKATAVEPDGTSWPLVIHPDGQVDATEVTDTGKKKPIWPILVAAGAAIVLIGGVVGFLLLRGPSEPVVPAGPPTLPSLPAPDIHKDVFDARPLPPGFTSTANWSVDLARDTVPAVSADGTMVAIRTTDDKVALLSAAGKVLWQDSVPGRSESPVFTSIDGKPVVAVRSDKTLLYWPLKGDVAAATEVEIDSGYQVNFFGPSPMATTDDGKAFVIVDGTFVEVTDKPRRATFLLANGHRALMAGYYGPLWWGEPGKPSGEVDLQKPPGATGVHHVAFASQGRVIVMWSKSDGTGIPAVHDAASGRILATCQATTAPEDVGNWVPDQVGKVAALNSCLIDFTKRKTFPMDNNFSPVSVMGTSFFGDASSSVIVTPGQKARHTPQETARPWGIAGGQAVVVHDSVVYVLAPKK